MNLLYLPLKLVYLLFKPRHEITYHTESNYII